jgi:hypothetical protein
MSSDVSANLRMLFNKILRRRGWDRSLTDGPVDGEGNPLPWVTYPALSMLEQLSTPEQRVFEFGAGNSSLWWATRSSLVVSVDHNEAWISRLAKACPENLKLIHKPRGAQPLLTVDASIMAAAQSMAAEQVVSKSDAHNVEHGLLINEFIGYATTLIEYPRGYFDVIVVDGMARSFCAYLAAMWVKPHGFIVFDNSDRWQYGIGYEVLRDFGFGRVDFFGAGPVNTCEWSTSIFFRELTQLLTIQPRKKIPNDLGW